MMSSVGKRCLLSLGLSFPIRLAFFFLGDSESSSPPSPPLFLFPPLFFLSRWSPSNKPYPVGCHRPME